MLNKCNNCGCYSNEDGTCSCGGNYVEIDSDELLLKIYYHLRIFLPKKKWYKKK